MKNKCKFGISVRKNNNEKMRKKSGRNNKAERLTRRVTIWKRKKWKRTLQKVTEGDSRPEEKIEKDKVENSFWNSRGFIDFT